MGIRISVGHSEATAETVMHAIDDGITGVTHLFNAKRLGVYRVESEGPSARPTSKMIM